MEEEEQEQKEVEEEEEEEEEEGHEEGIWKKHKKRGMSAIE